MVPGGRPALGHRGQVRTGSQHKGLAAFLKQHPKARPLIIEGDAALEAFLLKDLATRPQARLLNSLH